MCVQDTPLTDKWKKVLSQHDTDPSHKAAVKTLHYTSALQGVVATVAANASSLPDHMCNQKVCISTFIAEHNLSFTISPILVDRTALSKGLVTLRPNFLA